MKGVGEESKAASSILHLHHQPTHLVPSLLNHPILLSSVSFPATNPFVAKLTERGFEQQERRNGPGDQNRRWVSFHQCFAQFLFLLLETHQQIQRPRFSPREVAVSGFEAPDGVSKRCSQSPSLASQSLGLRSHCRKAVEGTGDCVESH